MIGVEEIAYPIDIFETATLLSEHPDAHSNLEELFLLTQDRENYFTRWAAIRAISQMGRDAVEASADLFRQRVEMEDYELARKELSDALAKLKGPAT